MRVVVRVVMPSRGNIIEKARKMANIIIIMYFYSASIQLPAQERFYE